MKTGTTLKKPITNSEVKSGRTLVMGDIHGSFRGMVDVLNKCNYTALDTLIILGDLVDGYPDAATIIEHIIQMYTNNNAIILKGNHDKWLENYLTTGIADKLWLEQGGEITKKSVDAHLRANPSRWEVFVQFLRSMHLYYVDDQNRLFVHAGINPNLSLEQNKRIHGEDIFLWDRKLVQSAQFMQNSPESKVTFIPTQEMFTEIFVGHTSTEIFNSTKPMNFCNVWDLDTGAGYKGKLTIMDVNTKEYWQSDFSNKYYKHD